MESSATKTIGTKASADEYFKKNAEFLVFLANIGWPFRKLASAIKKTRYAPYRNAVIKPKNSKYTIAKSPIRPNGPTSLGEVCESIKKIPTPQIAEIIKIIFEIILK